ncbi:hypothetical protein C0Q70_08233 [Pomacea canaliculata]|uniref:Peptidase metallopeptidase domain-containing protein n=1 Tax=Pomacea canaliculata TaxID=400727 RepID=A0A2T7PHA7_POMCA|nr:collagenase 3-like [Pomacea canaliculata]PVD32787.1 hypothetical protein C0Q70_08233 [Pomacea canaliculata]
MTAATVWRWSVLTAVVVVVVTYSRAAPATDFEHQEVKTVRQVTQSVTSVAPAASALQDRFANNEKEDNVQMAENFLSSYGYFRKGQSLSFPAAPVTGAGEKRYKRDATSDLTDAVRMFQSFYGLPQTGRLDEATVDLMKRDRCGVADIPEDDDNTRVARSTDSESPQSINYGGARWQHNTLTWKLGIATKRLDESDQRKVMHDAFHLWKEQVPLEFQEVTREDPADIVVLFGTGHHGDKSPFDGRGKVLAHAYAPGRNELAGDIHFDDDEPWTTNTKEGSDLLSVASHELGHSLGLGHSRDPSALMYAFYGMQTELTLGDDDIQAIQTLYGVVSGTGTGSRPATKRPPTTVRPMWVKSFITRQPLPPASEPPTTAGCGIDFDFIIKDHQDVFIGITGNEAHRFTSSGALPGNPVSLDTLFPGALFRPNAVFSVPERKATYFIAGNRVWRYTDHALDSGYPQNLNIDFPDVIRFVLALPDTTGQPRFFVFGSTHWVEYDFDQPRQQSPRHYLIPQYWPGVTTDVKYGIAWNDGNTYLITPDSHVVFNIFRRSSNSGKQPGCPPWLRALNLQASPSQQYSRSAASGLSAWSWMLLTLLVSLGVCLPGNAAICQLLLLFRHRTQRCHST